MVVVIIAKQYPMYCMVKPAALLHCLSQICSASIPPTECMQLLLHYMHALEKAKTELKKNVAINL